MYKADEVAARVKEMQDAGADKAEIIREASKMCLGWPYVFAASGNACTPDVRRRFANARPDHAAAITSACPVLSGKQATCAGCKWDGVLCDDCRGFTRYMLSLVGLQLYGDTVSTQWETDSNWVKKGDIAEMPKNLVCCVFRTGHTGMYMGSSIVRHCGGKKGCVQEETMPGLPQWLRYGLPAGLYTQEELESEGIYVDQALNFPTLRRGAKGQSVEWLQMMLNEETGAGLIVDGVFGAATEDAVKFFQKSHPYLKVDGIVGPKTWEALKACEDSPVETPDEEPQTGNESDPEDPGEDPENWPDYPGEEADEQDPHPPDMVSVPREALETWADVLEEMARDMRDSLNGGG